MNVGDLLASLGLDSTSFMTGLNQATQAARRASRQIASSLNMSTAADGTQQVSNNLRNATENNRLFHFGLKDTQRVLAGILMARAFNAILRDIESATKAVINFNAALEQTEISFKYLLNSADAASALTNKLQDIASYTPFTVDSAASTTKQLLAMGVSAKEVEEVLWTMSDAVSALGGSEVTFERVGYAMGQIKASSKLLAQDVRQLINAGIPAWEILREELGMTQEQLNKTVRSGLSSNTAYYALLSGMQKRYAGASKEQSKTWNGLKSTISDLSLQIGNMFTTDMFAGAKDQLAKLTDSLQNVVDIGRQRGAGGVLNSLFPNGAADNIRMFIAALAQLAKGFMTIISTIWPVIKAIGQGLMMALTIVLGPLGKLYQLFEALKPLLEKLAPLITAITAAWATWTILSKVIALTKALSAAIGSLTIMKMIPAMVTAVIAGFTALAAAVGPAAAAVIMLVAGLGVLVGAGSLVNGMLENISKGIMNIVGIDYGSILPEKEMDDYEKQWNDYLNGISDGTGDIADGMEDAEDATKKFIAAFDEVFQVPEEDATSALDKFTDSINKDLLPSIKDAVDQDWGKDIESPDWNIPLIIIPIKWNTPPFPTPPSPINIPVNYAPNMTELPQVQPLEVPVNYVESQPLTMPEIQPLEIPVEWQVPEFPDITVPEFPDIDIGWGIEDFPKIEMPVLPDIEVGWDIKMPELPTIDWKKFFRQTPQVEIGVEVEDGNTATQTTVRTISEITKRIGEMVEPIDISTLPITEMSNDMLKTLNAAQLSTEQLQEMQNFWSQNEHNVSQYFTSLGTQLKEYKRLLTESGRIWDGNFFQQNGLEAIPTALGSVKTAYEDLDAEVRKFNTTRNDTMGIFSDWRDNPMKQAINEITFGVTDMLGALALVATGGSSAASQVASLGGSTTIAASTMDDLALAASKYAAPAVQEVTNKIIQFSPQLLKGGAAAAAFGQAMNLAAKDVDSSGTIMTTAVDSDTLQMVTSLGVATAGVKGFSTDTQTSFQQMAIAAGIELPKVSNSASTMQSSTCSALAETIKQMFGFSTESTKMSDSFGAAQQATVASALAMQAGVTPTLTQLDKSTSDTKDAFALLGKTATQSMTETENAVKNKTGGIQSLFDKMKSAIDEILSKIQKLFGFSKDLPGGSSSDAGTQTYSVPRMNLPGYASGGIINREQIIRVGEGNKSEAVVPLQNDQAMAPFAEAIASRLNKETPTGTGGSSGNSERPILYVGTLVADDRSLRELNRRMEVIQAEENSRSMK